MRTSGRRGSENAGMSSEKESENLSRRKPKVSQGRFVRLSLAGPKPRAKAVGDGQPVDIPAPVTRRYTDGGTQKGRPPVRLVVRGQSPRGTGWQIQPVTNPEGDGDPL